MKNPWLSLWLSGANTWANVARGMMTAEMKRTQRSAMDEATRQATAFWFPSPPPGRSPTPKRKTTRRR